MAPEKPTLTPPPSAAWLAAWQQRMGYTQQQAAAALGIGLAPYRDYWRGFSRDTDKPMPAKAWLLLAARMLERDPTLAALSASDLAKL